MAGLMEKRKSSLEGLLYELYDWSSSLAHCSLDTEAGTDTSTSNYYSDHYATSARRNSIRSSISSNAPPLSTTTTNCRRKTFVRRATCLGIVHDNNSIGRAAASNAWVDDDIGVLPRFDEATLWTMSTTQLTQWKWKLGAEVESTSHLLVQYLKRNDQRKTRCTARCNQITAILQALSEKRSVDAKLQFSLELPAGENGYDQWLNAMRSVARLQDGMPHHFRKRLWLMLADHYVKTANIDWQATSRRAFNERMNDDDDELSLQIVKDLHRTGWSGLNGEVERVLLKRVLLAYARFNKTIGYCQGFNVIAALILDVMEYNEETALKVMIMLIENVLPSGYFDQTLRALSVDMAVLRELVQQRLPNLSAHLDYLMLSSESEFEPPLTNVFSMQWFLTLFATCLPKQAVFRIWDSLMLEGSEILLRAALAIWAKIGRRIYKAKTADSYYTIMGEICQELLHMTDDQCNHLMHNVYRMAEFPYPGLSELRDKYTWNIQPFSSTFRLLRQQVVSILKSDDEGGSDLVSHSSKQGAAGGCGFLTPPAQGNGRASSGSAPSGSAGDLSKLEKQYKLMRQRQKQAAVILQNALTSSNNKRSSIRSAIFPTGNNGGASSNGRAGSSNGGDSEVFNHLYLSSGPNQTVCTSAMKGTTFPLAPRAVQPSVQPDPRLAAAAAMPSPRTNSGRLRSADSVPPASVSSPPASPVSIRTGSMSSTPTSSGGGSTPAISSPVGLLAAAPWPAGPPRARRYSVGNGVTTIPPPTRCCERNRRHSYSEFSITAIDTKNKSYLGGSHLTNGIASSGHSRPSSSVTRVSSSALMEAAPIAHTKRNNRPPPLQLKMYTIGGDSTKPPQATQNKPERSRSMSSSSSARVFYSTTAANGTPSSTSSQQAHAMMLKKSKAILASISSIEDVDEETNGEQRRGNTSNAIRNPFPVKRQTALIERGKRMGLYS